MTRSSGMPTPRPTPRPILEAVLDGDGASEASIGVDVVEEIMEVVGVGTVEVAVVLVAAAVVLNDGTAFAACVKLK